MLQEEYTPTLTHTNEPTHPPHTYTHPPITHIHPPTYPPHTPQIRKALELHEQLKQRMGVVIVGPSGSGKSTVWRLLKAAMIKRGQMVKDYTMNPKAMPRTHVRIHR